MAGKDTGVVIWRLRRLMRAMRWPAAAAIGLLAFETAFYFSSIEPAMDRAAKLRDEVKHVRLESMQGPEQARTRANSRVELAQFYAAFAQPSNAPDLLRKLHRVAHDQGLTLDQADYRPMSDAEGKLTRYQILLPTKGTYPEVRRFLVQASSQVPGLAIDGIKFQRQQIGNPVVEAQIKLTLFLGAPS